MEPNWLSDWIATLEGGSVPKPIARQHYRAEPGNQRQPEPEIKTVWFTTRLPRDGDQGAVEAGYYSVSEGIVTMHDATGKPAGKKCRLGPGDDPHRTAQRLTREAWLKNAGTSDFNRSLNYQPLGIA
jgi:hypothetical protein